MHIFTFYLIEFLASKKRIKYRLFFGEQSNEKFMVLCQLWCHLSFLFNSYFEAKIIYLQISALFGQQRRILEPLHLR